MNASPKPRRRLALRIAAAGALAAVPLAFVAIPATAATPDNTSAPAPVATQPAAAPTQATLVDWNDHHDWHHHDHDGGWNNNGGDNGGGWNNPGGPLQGLLPDTGSAGL
ncbi:hypothetical protein [Nocardia sp. NPDC020380]|uniref:hypothetical protein n=1 Tax=Nocardia sp. NPDC020380 TaxID=3364309 RepID=UPI0037B3038C